MQPGDTVRVDAAQVASGEHVGGLLGVGSRHAEVHEDLGGEVAEIGVRKKTGCRFVRGCGHAKH